MSERQLSIWPQQSAEAADAAPFALVEVLESLLYLLSALLRKKCYLVFLSSKEVFVWVFSVENVAATTDPGVSLLPALKQELDAAEEFGPKLPPAFSSGRFCRLAACKFCALKPYIRYTIFLFKTFVSRRFTS